MSFTYFKCDNRLVLTYLHNYTFVDKAYDWASDIYIFIFIIQWTSLAILQYFSTASYLNERDKHTKSSVPITQNFILPSSVSVDKF